MKQHDSDDPPVVILQLFESDFGLKKALYKSNYYYYYYYYAK